VAFKGAFLAPDSNADLAYYGQFLTVKEILFDKKVKPTPAAIDLAKKISDSAR